MNVNSAKEELLIKTIYENKNYFYRIAKRMLHNEHDVEDALQETIYRSFKSLNNLKEDQYIKTWITRILINQCYNLLKKQSENHELHSEEGLNDKNYQNYEIIDLINRLDSELKTISILFYYEDLQQSIIAEILDIPVGTVKSRLSRARSELKRMIGMEV
ncbi:MAG: polymerase sigma factor, sigma-70 family protein [Bacillales bacterium]|nr:polymerase sigma factor, sigma-70 family protein [Bacillales bacterium]